MRRRGKRTAHDVFISYATHNKPIADAVCAGLEGAQTGFRVDVRLTKDHGTEQEHNARARYTLTD